MSCQLEQDTMPSTGRRGHDLVSLPRPPSISGNDPTPTGSAAAAAGIPECSPCNWVWGGEQHGADNGEKRRVTPARTGDADSQAVARKDGNHLPSASFDSTCRWALSTGAVKHPFQRIRRCFAYFPDRLLPPGQHFSCLYLKNSWENEWIKGIGGNESEAQKENRPRSDSHPIDGRTSENLSASWDVSKFSNMSMCFCTRTGTSKLY